MGVLMMALASCVRAAPTTDDEEILQPRQTRGLVLRSWRNAQQQQQQQTEQGADKDPSTKMAESILSQPKEAMVLAGLPISMRLVLLQRLAAHDKRTPNGRAFLGMRGKKSGSFWSDQEEENLMDMAAALDSSADVYGPVPQKKKVERFLGMRGKKMSEGSNDLAIPDFYPNWRERYVFQQPFQQGASKKRAPSSNSFMGMRGKRSGWTMPVDEDYELNKEEDVGEEQPVAGSKIPPRYEERSSTFSISLTPKTL